MMRAIDAMVRDVVTVHPDTSVADAIALLSKHDVSALPVVDGEGHLLGVISEADLIHRVEIGTEKHRPWWTEAMTGTLTLADEFAKAHGKTPAQVILRWHIQIGVVVIPKSANPQRIVENISVFDFALSDEEMKRIEGLDKPNGRIGPDPATFC